jgi:hypothetical protein
MLALGTYQLVGVAYEESRYGVRILQPWDAVEDDPLWNGLNLGASISFTLSVFLQDSMLVNEASLIFSRSILMAVMSRFIDYQPYGISAIW